MKKPNPFRVFLSLFVGVVAVVVVVVVAAYAVDYLLWDEQIQFNPVP